jgi:dTDP-4-amino-4,6-dideoxygalactose transaminase
MKIRKIHYVNLVQQHQPIQQELVDAVAKVIGHGQFIFGEEVRLFEQQFAELCGTRYAVGVNSGLDALIIAFRALNIGTGDEVITVPNSFIASASCIGLVGARPVFVDVRDDFNIDPNQIETAITPRTKAILPVHLTGRPAEMQPILEIAERHGLFVIEDAAQAVSATYHNQPVGSFGTVGCFSLHPLKNLNACGDGGVLTTNNAELAEKFKLLRNHGLETRDECAFWGLNSRLDSVQAAILLVKLKYLSEWIEKRRRNAQFYQEKMKDIPELKVPLDKPYEKAVYHTFIIQTEQRDELKEYLQSKGIGTAIHYPKPIHLQKVAANLRYGPGSFPMAERQASQILSLPVYPDLTTEELECVVETIREFY